MNTLLLPEQINSKFLKKELAYYLFWRLHYPVIIDEHQFMDLFGIRNNGYMVEFEIKCSKADLMREVRLISGPQPIKYSKDWVKWEKHANYLNRKIDPNLFYPYAKQMYNILGEAEYFIPNEFYFYVPDFLAETAVEQLINTPYGVIKCGAVSVDHFDGTKHEYYSQYKVVKPAIKLHKEKATDRIYRQVAHGLTIRNRLLAE